MVTPIFDSRLRTIGLSALVADEVGLAKRLTATILEEYVLGRQRAWEWWIRQETDFAL